MRELSISIVAWMAGMPISTAFIGEDMLLEELIAHSPVLASMVMVCLMFSGLICVKIYTRLFMGRPLLAGIKAES